MVDSLICGLASPAKYLFAIAAGAAASSSEGGPGTRQQEQEDEQQKRPPVAADLISVTKAHKTMADFLQLGEVTLWVASFFYYLFVLFSFLFLFLFFPEKNSSNVYKQIRHIINSNSEASAEVIVVIVGNRIRGPRENVNGKEIV